MGMCKPSGGINSPVFGPFGGNIKEIEGCAPNSRTDYYDEKTGQLLQQRWYDAEGKAMWDRDWGHKDSNNSHVFPHDHFWQWDKNKLHPPRSEYKGPNGERMNSNYC